MEVEKRGNSRNTISKAQAVLQPMPKHKPNFSFVQVTLKYIWLLSSSSMDLYLRTNHYEGWDTAIDTHTGSAVDNYLCNPEDVKMLQSFVQCQG